MEHTPPIKKILVPVFIFVALFVLYLSSLYNYLLFHTISEMFSICIAFTIFLLAWNSSSYIKNNYLLLVGTAYVFIGVLDLFHTMSYKGMQIFRDYSYYANQLWIATRYLESITLLLAFAFSNAKRRMNMYIAFTLYLFVTILILLSIFVWRVFPVCFVEGEGLTLFKKVSEYIICGILLAGLFFLNKHRSGFDGRIFNYLGLSIIFTIISELAFTFYVDNYGFSNLIGHYFKIFSFYLIYKAIIEKGIREPYDIIFRELKVNEQMLSEQNTLLHNLAIIDGLTELYNRRHAYERLEEEISRCKRYESKLSIILFDIDHFKVVNDTHGHVTGDKILAFIAKSITDHIRCSDVASRYGGEEFLVILPETGREDAYSVAEKIRKVIEAAEYISEIRVTVSAGVSQYIGENASELVKSADQKLYEAKQNGRNRVQL